MTAPKQARLTKDEAHRIDRARLALMLHKLPSEVDAMPFTDVADLIEVMSTDRKLEELKLARTSSRRRGRR